MKDQHIKSDSSRKGRKRPEVRFVARAVSRGVGIGRAVCLHGTRRQFYRIELADGDITNEISRFRAAIDDARQQLRRLADGSAAAVSDSGPEIFDAQHSILADNSFQLNIEENITNQRVNAEWAVKMVADSFIAQYKAISDENLRERYIDLEDISERLLTALGGDNAVEPSFGNDAVLVATELKPSSLIGMADSPPCAIITENGGWTSHTFILARELGLPGVTGVKAILRRIHNGDTVIVDGYNGHIILNPEAQTLARYIEAAGHSHEVTADDIVINSGPAMTLDRREIAIFANADTPAVYARARQLGAAGIGLFRSEYLFNRHKAFPSEDEQVAAYSEMASAAGEGGVKIRTFDLSVAQLIDQNYPRENNPALGLRSLRLSFTIEDQLRTQVRALLRASFQKQIDIVLPMVSGVSEIVAFRAIFEEEKQILVKSGANVGDPAIGAMIELPSAVFLAREIAEATDFLCLGTNDLIQFLLGVDRDNETVSGWFRTLHPAVIRAIRTVISAAAAVDKPVVICGEMAGSPYYVAVLIGLGATSLSMNVNSITNVRRVICGLALEETRELIQRIDENRTAEDVENAVSLHSRKYWAHLFPPDFLDYS